MTLPKRRGLALTIIGAILMVVIAPAAGGIGIWQGVSHGMSAVDNQPWVNPNSAVQVTGHNSQTILVEGSYQTSEPLPRCQVAGPHGLPVPVSQNDGRLSMDWGGTALTRVGTFQPTAAGSYTIDCAGLRTKVLDSSVANDIARRVLVPIGIGVGIGALAFLAGVILLIVGIVKLVNSSRERTTARLAASGGFAGPYGGSAGPYGGGPTPYGPPPGAGPPPPGPKPGNPNDPYAR